MTDPRTGAARSFLALIPHAQMLGMQLVSTGDGEAVMQVPYDVRLIGDPETGVLHGGVVTALLDTCSGTAVMVHPTAPVGTATIDLRIDYMRPSTPGATLIARAVCYHTTRNVGFIRATAYETDESNPVATAAGAFTIERPRPKGASA